MTAPTAHGSAADERREARLRRSAAHDVDVFFASARGRSDEQTVEAMGALVTRVESGPAPAVYKAEFARLMDAKVEAALSTA